MIPIGAQAEAEATVYGRVNNAIILEDKGGTTGSTADIGGVGSRFGVKASSDLGNGLTAHGRYEFGTNTDDGAGGITSTRIATAGVSGGFGRVDAGNQWSAFYNSVGVDLDPTWTVGPVGSPTPFRSPNTIKYSNSVGPLALEADLRLGDEGGEGASLSGTGGGIGIRVAATDSLTIAAAFDLDDQTDVDIVTAAHVNDDGSTDARSTAKGNEHSRASISGKLSFGQFWGALGWSSHEAESSAGASVAEREYVVGYVGMSFTDSTSGWIGFSQCESDAGACLKSRDMTASSKAASEAAEPSKIAAGLYHNMGGGLQFWYEGGSTDRDEPGSDDAVKHWVGIRYDF